MKSLTIKNVMTARPIMIKPEQTVKSAARMMKENNCGVLPVGTPAKVLGMLTDRDITVRLVAEGGDALLTPVNDIMSGQVFLCEEGDSLEDAARQMRKHDVSRLMVSDGKMITGIVTLADLIRNTGKERASDEVLHELLYHGGKKSTHKSTCCA